MAEISPYGVLQRFIDDTADKVKADDVAASAKKFTPRFVEAAACLAGYGDGNQDRNQRYAALALNTWPAEDRDAFLAQHDVPGRVFQYMANPPLWRDPTGEE